MPHNKRMLEEEIQKLTQEIEDFKQEKERVRAIVGQIGGVPMLNQKVFEVIFFIALIGCLVFSFVAHSETAKMALLDIAVGMVSLKLLYMMRNQSRVSHFQLWVLSSIEWRLSSLSKQIKKSQTPVPSEYENQTATDRH